MMLLKFNEELHKYYLENENGSPLLEAFNKPFVSVSKFLDFFSEPFNEDEQAEKFVTSKKNKLGLKSAQEVKNHWKNRRELGTIAHAKRENKFIEEGAFTYNKDKDGHKICYSREEIKNLPLGRHCELTISMMSAWLIGTADEVIIYLNDKNERCIILRDIKSNGHKLVTEPKKFYQKEKGYSDFKYFNAPINHRPCDTFQKYTYQLSTYAYFLEKNGYKIDKLEIECFDMDDEGNETNLRILPVEYRRDDIINMIEYYKKVYLK